MSHQVAQSTVTEQSRKLMDGPLKHIKAAALAAALLPLASLAATPASAQTFDCASGGCGTLSGTVFNDTNNNGIQDAGETGIEGVKVYFCAATDPTCADQFYVETDSSGNYSTEVPSGTYTVSAQVPTGAVASPTDATADDSLDSDGTPSGGFSVAGNIEVGGGTETDTDFGFYTPPVSYPGTGTPGYWKNHPEAWPCTSMTVGNVEYTCADITVGGVPYTHDQAIEWLGKVGKDKTTTMFSSLVPAVLNVVIGNLNCVNDEIVAGDSWMATYGPVGNNVAASSYAWSIGEPIHKTLDAYNNGLLCAPHRK